MKVLITGAYSTGKTTLVRLLSDELISKGLAVTILSDSSREIFLPLNRNQGHDTTTWLLDWQMSKEKMATSILPAKTLLICDRGVPDILAHNLEAQSRECGLNNPSIIDIANDWLATYDLSFFSQVDDEIPIQADGVRVVDPNYRHALGELAKETVVNLDPCVVLPYDLNNRINLAVNEITKRLGR